MGFDQGLTGIGIKDLYSFDTPVPVVDTQRKTALALRWWVQIHVLLQAMYIYISFVFLQSYTCLIRAR